MERSAVLRLILVAIAVSLATAGAGCDSGGSGNDTEARDPLATTWKHPYQVAGGVNLAPKPVGDSLVLFGAEARLMALRPDDGSVKWRSPRVEPSNLELKAYELRIGGGVVFGSHVKRAKAWNLTSGAERWTYRPDTRFYSGGFYAAGSENFYASASGSWLLALDRRTGRLDYRRQYGHGPRGITYRDGALYFTQAWTPEGAEGQAQGGMMKVDATTGDSLWGFRTGRGGFYDGSPLVEDGRVYAGTHGGKAAFFAVDAETGEEVWRNEDAPTFAPPAYGPERIFINTSSRVLALSKETGRTVWENKVASGSGFRGVAYHEGYVYHPRGEALFVLNAETGDVVHKETSPSSYYWTLAAGPEHIYTQTSGHLVAYEPFQPE